MPIRLERYYVMIVSKYFKDIGDFIKLVHVCKKFAEIPAMFHYNPVSMKGKNKFFSNVETLHMYSKYDEDDDRYSKCVYEYLLSYSVYLELKSNCSTLKKFDTQTPII
ncbi:hypothetical protein EIN_519060 [Entamoeba invadens IP1]|uniref:Uncharacterized protein n=1 Tax=Entamoeba invadens IP1 TaxID=370355 RepID=A0A0A1U9U2_ENTIV|nr:hypothetical protein EIN_519060 [Entamoeba invadens IP1]ELP91709.1 hypothetical protein EIN_519060 [Entamoeba invadens IP1]|eukprot:XP_004258480.1 hypothetical protein EIN_519060 [Entamoeba invadens IP1]